MATTDPLFSGLTGQRALGEELDDIGRQPVSDAYQSRQRRIGATGLDAANMGRLDPEVFGCLLDAPPLLLAQAPHSTPQLYRYATKGSGFARLSGLAAVT
jgi:hypothetical protein